MAPHGAFLAAVVLAATAAESTGVSAAGSIPLNHTPGSRSTVQLSASRILQTASITSPSESELGIEGNVVSDLIATAVQTVPRQHYTHHPELGSVPQSTAQAAIERDLASAVVQRGMRVMEIGTGTGYTGALLAERVGPDGYVVSIDIDPSLTDRAGKLHAERGVSNITLVTADGHQGAAEHGPYDVIIGWATPTHIPAAWVEQCAPGGRIATPRLHRALGANSRTCHAHDQRQGRAGRTEARACGLCRHGVRDQHDPRHPTVLRRCKHRRRFAGLGVGRLARHGPRA